MVSASHTIPSRTPSTHVSLLAETGKWAGNQMPKELLGYIFSFLRGESLLPIRGVCQNWRTLSCHPQHTTQLATYLFHRYLPILTRTRSANDFTLPNYEHERQKAEMFRRNVPNQLRICSKDQLSEKKSLSLYDDHMIVPIKGAAGYSTCYRMYKTVDPTHQWLHQVVESQNINFFCKIEPGLFAYNEFNGECPTLSHRVYFFGCSDLKLKFSLPGVAIGSFGNLLAVRIGLYQLKFYKISLTLPPEETSSKNLDKFIENCEFNEDVLVTLHDSTKITRTFYIWDLKKDDYSFKELKLNIAEGFLKDKIIFFDLHKKILFHFDISHIHVYDLLSAELLFSIDSDLLSTTKPYDIVVCCEELRVYCKNGSIYKYNLNQQAPLPLPTLPNGIHQVTLIDLKITEGFIVGLCEIKKDTQKKCLVIWDIAGERIFNGLLQGTTEQPEIYKHVYQVGVTPGKIVFTSTNGQNPYITIWKFDK